MTMSPEQATWFQGTFTRLVENIDRAVQGKHEVISLVLAAMLAGRVVWGLAEILLLRLGGSAFTWKAFLAGALLNAIPGICLQLLLIPAVMVALNRTGLVRFRREPKKPTETT